MRKIFLARRGEKLLDIARMKISGMHNAANALAALSLGEAVGLPTPAMLQALESFPGLSHRSSWVADVGGVRFIDDSKGTNVGATIAAVAGMAGPLVVIAGGEGKGQDFTPLAEVFRGKVREAVLIGKDAPAIAAALKGVCETRNARRRWKRRWPRHSASRRPATPCCCRRPAPASTCFATTAIAAMCSRPR